VSENKMDFFEVGDKTSLICTDLEVGEVVQNTLRDLGFKFHSADESELAIERMRYTPYDIIVVQEDFAGSTLRSNPVLNYLNPLPMALRRNSMIVVVGSSFKTLDAMQAFKYSVHLVVNTFDLPNLTAIMKKGWAEFELGYRVYKSSLVSVSEA